MNEQTRSADHEAATDWLRRTCGLVITEQRRARFTEALESRRVALGLSDTETYGDYLARQSDPRDEVRRLACGLTVGETYFGRNEDHWRAFSRCVLPWLTAQRRSNESRCLRFWSAGCSTGEEAYTLAIAATQFLGPGTDWRVDVLGTDLNPASVQFAEEAVYCRSSFRSVDPAWLDRHFETVGPELHRPRPEVRRLVRFEPLNLVDSSAVEALPEMDVIFCRNVLIYFDPESRRDVLRSIHGRLHCGGNLFLGHSEHLHDDAFGFARVNANDAFFYQSFPAGVPVQDEEPPSRRQVGLQPDHNTTVDPNDTQRLGATMTDVPRVPTSPEDPAPKVSDRESDHLLKKLFSLRAVAEKQLCQQESDAAIRSFKTILTLDPGDQRSHIGLALCYSGVGDTDAALEHARCALEVDSLSPEAHGAIAVVYLAIEDDEQARRHFEKATYLDSNFAAAHLHLAWMKQRQGRLRHSVRHFVNTLSALDHEDPERVRMFSGGFDKGTIVGICEDQIKQLRSQKHAPACL